MPGSGGPGGLVAARVPLALGPGGPRRERISKYADSRSRAEQYNPEPGRQHFGLPPGSLWRERSREKGRVRVSFCLSPFALPVAHKRQKWGRSHHQHPSRAARRRAGRERNTRGIASLPFVAADAGNPCQPASNKAFQARPRPQRRGCPPSERKALWVPEKWPT